MKIRTAELSQTGGRPGNEDSVRCKQQDSNLAAVVADGLGGHGGGQIASSLTVDTIIDLFLTNPQINPDNIKSVFEAANQQVLVKQTPDCRMKSTGVALFFKDNEAIWAHVGDSRLYHFHNGKLAFQTTDHSVSQMAVLSGQITSSQIRFHEDRNKVLRAFGSTENIRTEISPILKLEGDFDAFLLCTDGFWEYVLEEEMESDLLRAKNPSEWLSFLTRRLEERITGNNDNYTAAAIFIINNRKEDGNEKSTL